MIKTFSREFLADMLDEEAFKKNLGRKMPRTLIEEIDAMTAVYNEQLDLLAKNRFDVVIYQRLAEIDPEGGRTPENSLSYKEKVINTKINLRNRRITIRTIREQILMKLGLIKLESNDQKS